MSSGWWVTTLIIAALAMVIPFLILVLIYRKRGRNLGLRKADGSMSVEIKSSYGESSYHEFRPSDEQSIRVFLKEIDEEEESAS